MSKTKKNWGELKDGKVFRVYKCEVDPSDMFSGREFVDMETYKEPKVTEIFEQPNPVEDES